MASCFFELRLSHCVRRRGLLLCSFVSAECVGGRSTGDGSIVKALACNYSDVAVDWSGYYLDGSICIVIVFF